MEFNKTHIKAALLVLLLLLWVLIVTCIGQYNGRYFKLIKLNLIRCEKKR